MGNCSCLSSQNNQASNTSNQKYKLLIIGPTFSGKTTFLKALQILYSNGFDEVSNEIYKDIMIRQIIFCVRTIVEHITSDDEKMEDEISYHSQITRDHSHLSVEDVTNTHHLSYSGGSIGLSSRSHLARQNSKSTKAAINMKKFHNPEIAKAAEFFLQTKFSQSSSYFEWLSNKKFIGIIFFVLFVTIHFWFFCFCNPPDLIACGVFLFFLQFFFWCCVFLLNSCVW